VLFNVNGQVEPWATPTIAAGIPIFAFSSADAGLIAAADLVSTMSNPVSGFGNFPAGLALELGVETSTISVIDVPAATGPAQALSAAIFGALGAGTANVLPISPAATDHSADIQADLQANNPGLVHVIGNAAYCTLTWKALRDAGFEGAIGGISNCIDDATIEQMGSDIEGIYISYTGSEDPSDPDYQTLQAIGDEYGLDFPLKGTPVGDYIVMEAFHRFMADYDGDYSSDSINAHIKGHAPIPVVGNPDASYNCDGSAVPGIPIACTSGSFYTQLDADGNPTTFTGIS
jgi:branched-chain amino acid transport system substrate-binding protein